ncbi:MAG: HPF/RaiA family ribosome-associated protein [Bacteroidales bacterium]|jgi:ribosomal subunit interface protein|nr:HPF/RaiA family ribosome-associated protein [Bacteroidales bacterium]MDD2770686.1 HPF/RaiA family ribosome-associated protein [Bacteroidales bacterium]MDD3549048.1 HPF/RaiA family ribosome-associated protein [Bacteroidales bacterium]MDD4064044.1 HPF/RaiA family ribosome-associated protein [Bacteroidales bacterium]MDD4498992.1 HPF/RaiA family ribosome-associated protein [Bacteroidales bacterium]
MDIKVESVKFDADRKLLDFINEKVGKLDRFFDAIMGAEVTLSLVPGHDNKKAIIRVKVPGNDLIAERACPTFEEAVATSVDILKENLVKTKEKMRGV